MGEWGYATFFHCDDVDAVERAIARVCENDGLTRVAYAPRTRDRWDAMQYGTAASSDRWSFAIGGGKHGWSIVRSAPFELLAEPTESGEHRLGVIARALGCEALHVSLYDGTAMVIAQASAGGDVVLSGYTERGLEFHGVAIDEARFAPVIDRIPLPRSIHEALDESLPRGLAALHDHLGDLQEDAGGRLVEGKPIAGARTLSFERVANVPHAGRLSLTLAVEEHALERRYVLDDAVWITETAIEAIDADRGLVFLRKLAAWLDTPLDDVVPGIPLGAFALLAPAADAPRQIGVQTHVLSIGARGAAELLLHTAPAHGFAELEERRPTQRRRLLSKLTPALVGKHIANASYGTFTRLIAEPTPVVHATFAGDRLVATWWRRAKTALLLEGDAVVELDGLCNAIAATSRHIALSLVTPELASRATGNRLQGYSQMDPARVVQIDVATGRISEVLRSDAALTFGFTQLEFRDGTLLVGARRGRTPVIVTVEDGGRRGEVEGELAAPAPPEIDVAAAGVEPLAVSANGERCLVHIHDRRIWVGARVSRSE